MKLCVNCKHSEIGFRGFILCNHPKNKHVDLVNGRECRYIKCARGIRYPDAIRSDLCGMSGEWWEAE